jgi:hypothetical protein
VATIIYVGISQRIFALTNDLKVACVPSNNKLIGLHAVFAAGWMAATVAIGFVLVRTLGL